MSTSTTNHMNVKLEITSIGVPFNSADGRQYHVKMTSETPGHKGHLYVSESQGTLTLGELLEVEAAIHHSHANRPTYIPYLHRVTEKAD